MSLLTNNVFASPGTPFWEPSGGGGGGGGGGGATGPTGATGATGAQGDQGDIGLPGTAFVFYGTWVPGTNYAKNALVVSPADRNTYVALITIINGIVDPSVDTLKWRLYALGGQTGAAGATGPQGLPGSGANAQFWANFQATQDIKCGSFDIVKPGGKLHITSPVGVSIDGGNDLISLNAGNIIITQNNAVNSLYLGAQTAVNIVGGAGVAVSAGAAVTIQSALATLINGIGGVAITGGGAVTIQALGACSMTAVGALNIGSGASYTTIEGVYLDNNLIDRYNNGPDIEIKHIHLLQNTADGSNAGQITVDARGSIFMTATQVNNGNKNTTLTIDAAGRRITMGNQQAGGQPFELQLQNPGGSLSMSYNSGADLSWSSSSGNVNFNGLNTVNCYNIFTSSITGQTLRLTAVPTTPFANVLTYDAASGNVAYKAAPSGEVLMNSISWSAVGNTYGSYSGSIPISGLTSSSQAQATLSLKQGYANIDVDKCVDCWLVATVCLDTGNLHFVLAGNPAGVTAFVVISWAIHKL